MDTFINFLLQAIINAVLVYFVFFLIAQSLRNSIEEAVNKLGNNNQGSEPVEAYVEITENSLLLYRKDRNEFIAQGKDFKELEANTKKRFPDLIFKLSDEEYTKAKDFK